MTRFANRVKVQTATQGTGPIVLGAAVSRFQDFAEAGISNGDTVRYVIEDGDAWEVGLGVYSASATETLSRAPTESSNSNQQIALSGSATVFLTATAEDFNEIQSLVTTTAVAMAQMAAAYADQSTRFVEAHAFE